MWSDTSSHGQTFTHGQLGFGHAPALDRLCLHSRLGCVLAGSLRSGVRGSHKQDGAGSLPSTSEVSAEAAIFVAVIVVFYAAIIVILLGTNMRGPNSSSSRPRRSRSRSRSRSRHQLVLDPRDGSVSTQHTHKKDLTSSQVEGVNNV